MENLYTTLDPTMEPVFNNLNYFGLGPTTMQNTQNQNHTYEHGPTTGPNENLSLTVLENEIIEDLMDAKPIRATKNYKQLSKISKHRVL